jgi:hypothetical protein
MAVREKVEGASIRVETRHPPDPDAGCAENCIRPRRRVKESSVPGSIAGAAELLELNNRRAKIRMSAELVRMGFSPEAVGRILNLEFTEEESV